jgi:hypothetical protein
MINILGILLFLILNLEHSYASDLEREQRLTGLGLKGQVDVCEIPVHGLNMQRQLAIISKKTANLSPAAKAFAGVLAALL